MIKKFNYYTGSSILGYKIVTPEIMSQGSTRYIEVTKPIPNNGRGIDYNCDKKLLKTTYRKRRKLQLPNSDVVVNIK